MVNIKHLIAVCALLFSCMTVSAQPVEISVTDKKQYRQDFYRDYSRWSVGADMGFSFIWGDMRSFSDNKNYWGGTWGVSGAYQFTPTVGVGLGLSYNLNKAGAPGRSRDFLVEPDGFTYHGALPPDGAARYGELYSRIRSWSFGLNAAINVNNLFRGTSFAANRRWTVIASPGIYLTRFRTGLYYDESGENFNTTQLHYKWSFGLGGEAAVRYKAGRLVDVQLKGSAVWITDNKFDGIKSATTRKRNGMSTLQAGVIFKVGARSKKDHLIYAPVRKYVPVPPPMLELPVAGVRRDTLVIERTTERIIEKQAVVEAPGLPMLPSIHFERGSMDIDEVRYARELGEIVSALKRHDTVRFEILGFADHTGSESINETISFGRAEALRNYLVGKGIDIKRITDIRGMGKDHSLHGEAALSVKARRAEIVRE